MKPGDQDYEYSQRHQTGRETYKIKSFTDCIKEYLSVIKDVILVVPDKNEVDMDTLIDILTDSQQQSQETLELYALRAIRKTRRKEIDMEELAELLKAQIEALLLKDNVRRWWASLKCAGNVDSKQSFQVKKIREIMKETQEPVPLGKEKEQTFKNRNIWTYNQLLSSCKNYQ